MVESVEGAVRGYYAALRAGEPLHPFFVDDGPVVKVGVWSRHVGAEAVASELREQTATTEDWVVESRDLDVGTVGGRRAGPDRGGRPQSAGGGRGESDGGFAWFGDVVSMAWTERGSGDRHAFETRWTGAMVRRGGPWRFVEMHVSVPGGSGGPED